MSNDSSSPKNESLRPVREKKKSKKSRTDTLKSSNGALVIGHPTRPKPIKYQSMVFGSAKLVGVIAWEAKDEKELSFKVGDIIDYLEHDDNGWVLGIISSTAGWFPQDNVRFISGPKNPFDAMGKRALNKDEAKDKLNQFLKIRPPPEALGTRIQAVEKKKKADGLSRLLQRVSRNNSKKYSVFGKTIPELVQNPNNPHDIPVIVRQSVEYLQSSGGIQLEGIFRVSGSHEVVERIRGLYNSPTAEVNLEEVCSDPHCVAVLLKQFLMSMPEPVIPFHMYNKYVTIYNSDYSEEQKVSEFHTAVRALPPSYRAIFCYLMKFLREVTRYSETTKMGSQNLGLVFGPNMIRPLVADTASLMDPTNSRIIEFCLNHYPLIFEVD